MCFQMSLIGIKFFCYTLVDPITQQVSELVLTSSTSDYEVVATSKEEDQSSVVEYSTDGVVESDHEQSNASSNASSNDEDNDVVVIEVEPGVTDENGKNEEYVCCVIMSMCACEHTFTFTFTNSTTHTYPLICIAHGRPCTAKNHQMMIVLKCVRHYIPCLHVYSLFYSHHGD